MKRIISAACAAVVLAASLVICRAGVGVGFWKRQRHATGAVRRQLHECAIRESGDGLLLGRQRLVANLGRDTGTTATTTVASVFDYDTTLAQSISVNNATVCAVLLNRAVRCWGNNACGAGRQRFNGRRRRRADHGSAPHKRGRR